MPAYCKAHAEDDMVDVRSQRCLQDSCTTRAGFNVEGSKVPAYCKPHAEAGMVRVRSGGSPSNKRSCHNSSSRGRRRLTDGTGGKAAKRARLAMPGTVVIVAEEHPCGEPMKAALNPSQIV